VNVQCQYSDIHDDPAGSVRTPQNGILSQTGKKSRIAIGRAARLWDQDDEICKQWTGNCTACNGCLLTSSNVGRRMTCIVSHPPKSGQRTSACECNKHSCSQVHVKSSLCWSRGRHHLVRTLSVYLAFFPGNKAAGAYRSPLNVCAKNGAAYMLSPLTCSWLGTGTVL